jgi:hypothetical protein
MVAGCGEGAFGQADPPDPHLAAVLVGVLAETFESEPEHERQLRDQGRPDQEVEVGDVPPARRAARFEAL